MNDPGDADAQLSHLVYLAADAERIESVLHTSDLETPVPSCPGWDLTELAAHLGRVHRWATDAVLRAEPPDPRPATDAERRDIVSWFRKGADALLEVLTATDPDAPTWHPFPAPLHAGVWRRRQAHETAMHRRDAELAVAQLTPIPPELASDGIDEWFEIHLPRLLRREGVTAPHGSLHVHCTDVSGEWLVHLADGEIELRREHAKGDAAIRGPAEAILLALWHRRPTDGSLIDVIGDRPVAGSWLDLPGL